MLDTNSDPNLVAEANSGNFDQNSNLDELFPTTTDANTNSMMSTNYDTIENNLTQTSQFDPTAYGLENDDSIDNATDGDVDFEVDFTGSGSAILELKIKSTTNDPLTNFDVFWDTFAENYAMFPLKDVDWSERKEQYRSQVTSETTPEQLFEILSSAIEPLNDAHTRIVAEDIGKTFNGARDDSDYEALAQKSEQIKGITEVLNKTLPNGWKFGLGNQLIFNEEEKTYETEGIPADVQVPVFTDEDLANGRDRAIEKTEEILAA